MSKKATTTVTTVVTCYNKSKYIAQAIKSCLDQKYPEHQLIVVDDGSLDNSLDVINKYKKHIEIIKSKHKGSNFARNLGLKAAKGKWIQFIDGDDYILSNKLSLQMDAAKNNIDMVLGRYQLLSGKNRTLGPPLAHYEKLEPKIAMLAKDIDHLPHGSCCLFRVAYLKKIGGWDNSIRIHQDWDLVIRAIIGSSRIACMNSVVYSFRKYAEGRLTDLFTKYDTNRIEMRMYLLFLMINSLSKKELNTACKYIPLRILETLEYIYTYSQKNEFLKEKEKLIKMLLSYCFFPPYSNILYRLLSILLSFLVGKKRAIELVFDVMTSIRKIKYYF